MLASMLGLSRLSCSNLLPNLTPVCRHHGITQNNMQDSTVDADSVMRGAGWCHTFEVPNCHFASACAQSLLDFADEHKSKTNSDIEGIRSTTSVRWNPAC